MKEIKKALKTNFQKRDENSCLSRDSFKKATIIYVALTEYLEFLVSHNSISDEMYQTIKQQIEILNSTEKVALASEVPIDAKKMDMQTAINLLCEVYKNKKETLLTTYDDNRVFIYNNCRKDNVGSLLCFPTINSFNAFLNVEYNSDDFDNLKSELKAHGYLYYNENRLTYKVNSHNCVAVKINMIESDSEKTVNGENTKKS